MAPYYSFLLNSFGYYHCVHFFSCQNRNFKKI
ncbi:hypothetical protein AMTRI_Chr06g171300 [Amborella trichopoda]